jgi:hypothetical protein
MTIKTTTSKGSYFPSTANSQVDEEEDCIPIAEAHAVFPDSPPSRPREASEWWENHPESAAVVVVAEPTVFHHQYEEQAFPHGNSLWHSLATSSERVPLHHSDGNYVSTVLETPAEQPAYMAVQDVVEKPNNMTVHRRDSGDTIVIEQKWVANGETYPLLFFACIWNGFMLFWNVTAITSGAWIMLFFGSLHNAVGLFLIYRVACQFLNTTFVTVSHHKVEVKHTPLSFSPPKYFKVAPMQQVDCKRCVTQMKGGDVQFYYEVNLVIKNANYPGGKQRVVILSNLKHPEEALFFAQEIESFLANDEPDDSASSKNVASPPISII